MPELPEVETVKRSLAPFLEPALVLSVDQRRANLRFPFPHDFPARLKGRTIEVIGRRAKYLLFHLSDGTVLVSHLGMSGSFRLEKPGAESQSDAPGSFHFPRSRDRAHDHLAFLIDGPRGIYRLIYNDPRRFGYMDLIAQNELPSHPYFKDLGTEPIGNAFGPDILAAGFEGKASPLKAALLDQRIVAGLGNIYVCEALWRAGLSPRRKAKSLVTNPSRPDKRLHRLAAAIRDVIDDAVEAGGSTLRDFSRGDGKPGYFQHSFAVYDRAGNPCMKADCTGTVKRIVQSGRSTFYCSACQR